MDHLPGFCMVICGLIREPIMGVTEEAGKAATSAIDALKSTPVILGVLVFNLAFMGFVGYLEHENGHRWERTVERTINYCIPAGHSPQAGTPKLQSDDTKPFEFPKQEAPPP